MATATEGRTDQWVDATTAAGIVGSGTQRRHVYQWAGQGVVRVRRIPGLRPKYNRADLERLARDGGHEGGNEL